MILESGPNSTHYSPVLYMSSMTHAGGVQSFNLNYLDIIITVHFTDLSKIVQVFQEIE